MPSLPRRQFVTAAAAASAAAILAPRAFARVRPAWAGYAKAVVIDALGGPGAFDPASLDPSAPLTARMLADVRDSGLTAANVTVGAVGNGPTVFEETVQQIAGLEREIDAHPDVFLKVTRATDIAAAKLSGRLGLVYGFQDTSMLGADLGRLDVFYNSGVRVVHLDEPILSATLSLPGEARPLSEPSEIRERLERRIDLVLDAGSCGVEPSTVIDLTAEQPVVVRRGRGSLEPFAVESV